MLSDEQKTKIDGRVVYDGGGLAPLDDLIDAPFFSELCQQVAILVEDHLEAFNYINDRLQNG